MICFFAVLIVLDTAHNLSPMAMAWSRGDFRAVMLRRWPQYILVPAFILATALAAASQPRPVVDAVVVVYFAWNVWHFASQNYGLLRLLQMRQARWVVRSDASTGVQSYQLPHVKGVTARCPFPSREFVIAVTIVGMVVWPILASDPWTWRLINLAIFAIPHWVTEIFLTAWASTRWRVFVPLILALGCVGFLWSVPRSTGMPVVGVAWVCFRIGLGFIHFLYDGMIWRFRDPEIRATIGKDLVPA